MHKRGYKIIKGADGVDDGVALNGEVCPVAVAQSVTGGSEQHWHTHKTTPVRSVGKFKKKRKKEPEREGNTLMAVLPE